MNVLYFDVETTGLPTEKYPMNHEMQPHITQLGFILEINGVEALSVDTFIRPEGWRIHEDSGTPISAKSTELTGITIDMCQDHGIPIADAMDLFWIAVENADLTVCHNNAFDNKLVAIEYSRLCPDNPPRTIFQGRPSVCTMKTATPVCQLRKKDGKTGYKWPKLDEAIMFFFEEELVGAHSAIVDIRATKRIFHELVERGAFDQQFHDFMTKGQLSPELFDLVKTGA